MVPDPIVGGRRNCLPCCIVQRCVSLRTFVLVLVSGTRAPGWSDRAVEAEVGVVCRAASMRRVSHLRLVVGRAGRLSAPSFGWPKAIQVAVRDRRGVSGEITLTWPGFAAPFALRAGGSDVLTFYQVIADNGYAMPFEVDAEPSVIMIRANIGLSSVWYANRFPRAQILAIEPEPDNFAQLLRNVASYPEHHHHSCTRSGRPPERYA